MRGNNLSVLLLVAGLIVMLAVNLFIGSVNIPAGEVCDILIGKEDVRSSWRFIVMESRLPQAVTAILCGAALSLSGLLLQTVFRNPLADPSVFGISSGAGLGVAVVTLLLGGNIVTSSFSLSGFVAVSLSAFLGAAFVTFIILFVSSKIRNGILIVIIGIMIGYIASSAITMLNFFATEEGVKSYVVWGMGNFGSVSSGYMPVFSFIIILSVISSALLIKPNVVLLITGVLVAVSTAFCGPIAFIGLSVPHISRILMRTDDYRHILPSTVLAGSLTALVCNFVCNLPGNRGVIPLNAVTPLIGAPVVIYVITRGNKLNLNQNIY